MSWDYDFPDGFEDWDAEQKCQWFEEERCKRQYQRQTGQSFESKADGFLDTLRAEAARIQRRIEANPAWVSLEKYR